MNEIEKLFRKISKKERNSLLVIIDILIQGEYKGLDIRKLTQSNFYRLRKGNFRIIFHYEKTGEIVIDSIRLRGEDTYKDFM